MDRFVHTRPRHLCCLPCIMNVAMRHVEAFEIFTTEHDQAQVLTFVAVNKVYSNMHMYMKGL